MSEIYPLSVMSLFITMYYNEIKLADATGFIVVRNQKPYLITNRHNVTGRNNITNTVIHKKGAVPNIIEIMQNSNIPGKWLSKKENLYDADNDPNRDNNLWIEHPTIKEKADFIALPLTNTEDEDIVMYPYELSENLQEKIWDAPAEQVSVIGFPFGKTVGGYTAIWSTGFIASEPQIDYEDEPKFLIDCGTRRGQSGSPVIMYRTNQVKMENGLQETLIGKNNSRLNFLGIYSGRINAESDLGIVWKRQAIKELVDSIKNNI